MGQVMGAVKTQLAGKADMGLVSAAVKQALIAEERRAMTSLTINSLSPEIVCVARSSTAADMSAAAAAGFKSVINNRPDFEGGPTQPTSAEIEAAAQAAGLAYAYLPVQPATQSPEEIARTRRAAGHPAQAASSLFCRSGSRSAKLFRSSQGL